MTAQSILAAAVRDSGPNVSRYLKGIDASTATKQVPGLPNHVVWTLGHLALTLFRCAARIDGTPPPADAFIDGTTGDAEHFATGSVSIGSVPTGEASIYPSLERSTKLFEASIERFAAALEAADDATLEKQVAWGKGTISVAAMASRLVFHNGTHAGQLADLRRALGFDRVTG